MIDSQYDFQRGHCADFAVALYQELRAANIEPTRLSFHVLRGHRNDDEDVLIHVYVAVDDIIYDSNMEPLTEDTTQHRIEQWLEFERWYGDANATAEVEYYNSVRELKSALCHCYRFSSDAQTTARSIIGEHPDLHSFVSLPGTKL